MRTSIIAIVLAATSCASVRVAPASQPSSLPDEYMAVTPGYMVPEPGFYLTMAGAVNELTLQSNHELEIQKQLKIMQLERDTDAKQLSRDEWCSRWCLPLGVVGGLIAGILGSSAVFAVLHH